jgi:acyl-CoA thioesterase-1
MVVGLIVVISIAIAIAFSRHQMQKGPVTSKPAQPAAQSDAIRYLPLGDSYTIGQSVPEADRWPNQLVARLSSQGTKLRIVDNPSVTGYTTQDLIDRELPLLSKDKPQFVTILIGVNDYVQGVPAATFTNNLNYIIATVQASLTQPKNVLLVTIPDYGLTPTGAEFGDPNQTAQGIMTFNTIIEQVAAAHDLAVADIYPVSLGVATDPSLIADDGLHPSGKEYTAWTNVIYTAMMASKLPLE